MEIGRTPLSPLFDVMELMVGAHESELVAEADHEVRVPGSPRRVSGDGAVEVAGHDHWPRHVYIRPRTPRLNGKVERSHRVDAQEFYQLLDQGGISDDIHLFNEKLREWEDYYNYHRPHGRWTAKPRTNDCWRKRGLNRYRRFENLQTVSVVRWRESPLELKWRAGELDRTRYESRSCLPPQPIESLLGK